MPDYDYYQARFAHLRRLERKRILPTPTTELRLHRLERPNPWPDDFRWEMAEAIRQSNVNYYPDYDAFKADLANFLDVSPTELVLGAGSENLVRNLMMLCVEPGKTKIAFTYPVCAMFDIYATIFGAQVTHIKPDPHAKPTMVQLLQSLPEDLKLLLLPNPGQPVETCYASADIAMAAEWCYERNCVLAIDEAYFGFGAPTAWGLVPNYDNLLVLRTFSKIWGGAGLRVGYAYGQPTVLHSLEAVRESSELSAASMAIVQVMLRNWEDVIDPHAAAVVDGRDWLLSELRRLPNLISWGGNANHVLIDVGPARKAVLIGQELWNSGVRVKFGFPDPISNCLLVTCGSRPVMTLFLERLKRLL